MDYLFLGVVIVMGIWISLGVNLIKRYKKTMFIGNQWHIPTPNGKEMVNVRHEDLSEIQWLDKKFPDRAFHIAWVNDDTQDKAVIYHRIEKEG